MIPPQVIDVLRTRSAPYSVFDTVRRQALKHVMLMFAPAAAATGMSMQNLMDEFCLSLAEPDPSLCFHGGRAGERNRCKHVSEDGVSVTCRSLALDRFLRLAKPKGLRPFSWCSLEGPDSYHHCLDIDAMELEKWRGKSVLDVGCGASFFPAECTAFGIQLTGADVNPVKVKRLDLLRCYAKSMLFLAVMQFVQQGTDPGLLDCPEQSAVWSLLKKFKNVGEAYLESEPVPADALKLASRFNSDSFDACLSSYMFCYLNNDQKQQAFEQMLRVTKVGGEIRICPGMQGIDASTSDLKCIEQVEVEGKTCRMSERDACKVFEVQKGGSQ